MWGTPVNLLIALAGLILLTLGRKLFWLFVACVGFSLGFFYAESFWNLQSPLIGLAIAVLMGLVGALLAVFLQGVAIALSGFAVGGFLTMYFLEMLGLGPTRLPWVPYVIGGISGAVALLLLFNWALIFLSSLLGAGLIVQVAELGSQAETVVFVVLAIAGILFQARLLGRGGSSGRAS